LTTHRQIKNLVIIIAVVFFADAIYVIIQPPREASLTEVVRRASG